MFISAPSLGLDDVDGELSKSLHGSWGPPLCHWDRSGVIPKVIQTSDHKISPQQNNEESRSFFERTSCPHEIDLKKSFDVDSRASSFRFQIDLGIEAGLSFAFYMHLVSLKVEDIIHPELVIN